jgi:hypothetical protein
MCQKTTVASYHIIFKESLITIPLFLSQCHTNARIDKAVFNNLPSLPPTGSRDSIVSTATRYVLGGPGVESRWGEIFHPYPDRLRGPPSLLYNGYGAFPGGKGGRGVMVTTHPLLAQRLRKSWAIPPLTPWVLLGLLRCYLYLTLLPPTSHNNHLL